VFCVQLAMEEALVNAIKHGNREDATKQVRVHCALSAERIRIEISDEGPGFDPTAVPDPTDDSRLEVPCGRGLLLMRSFMSLVEFNAAGNCVVMEKHRAADD
jgi:serine/threonine-protein kinase RsbW